MSLKSSLEEKSSASWLVIAATLALTVTILRAEGRRWWCACGQLNLWAGDVWSQHNSQHFLDPYSVTHVLHGVALCGLLAFLLPRLNWRWRLCLAVAVESLWEIIENSEFVIKRYREATAALGYHGDSVLNSLGDISCCALGFILARRLGLRHSIILFAATELTTLIWIHDSLLLNILMLIHPIDAIKAWQMKH